MDRNPTDCLSLVPCTYTSTNIWYNELSKDSRDLQSAIKIIVEHTEAKYSDDVITETDAVTEEPCAASKKQVQNFNDSTALIEEFMNDQPNRSQAPLPINSQLLTIQL